MNSFIFLFPVSWEKKDKKAVCGVLPREGGAWGLHWVVRILGNTDVSSYEGKRSIHKLRSLPRGLTIEIQGIVTSSLHFYTGETLRTGMESVNSISSPTWEVSFLVGNAGYQEGSSVGFLPWWYIGSGTSFDLYTAMLGPPWRLYCLFLSPFT